MIALPTIDVKELRHRENMSQSVFAWTYGIPLASLQNWEQKRRRPDPAANAYLGLILLKPQYVATFVAHKRKLNKARIKHAIKN